jgi:XTP/dITP diphosphohydrolase
MTHLDIRFISSNPYKLEEFQQLMSGFGFDIEILNLKIYEIQTEEIKKLVEDKAIQAFTQIGRPLVIEHTGLSLRVINGLPGGLTQMFWDRLEGDRFSKLFGKPPDNQAIATTQLAYCDGRQIHKFEGSIEGTISDSPRGDRHFQWDTVFIPDGHCSTFAEMGTKKNDISMRRRAIEKFVEFLKATVT